MKYRKQVLSICLAAALTLMSFPVKSYAVEAGMTAGAGTQQEATAETQSVSEESAETPGAAGGAEDGGQQENAPEASETEPAETEAETPETVETESTETETAETETVEAESTETETAGTENTETETAETETVETETAETETVETESTETATEDAVLWIGSFLQLPEEICTQKVEMGAVLEDIVLPEELEVTDQDGKTEILTGVVWESSPEFDGTAKGEYLFTPKLQETYMLAEKAALPVITVIVQEAAAQTGKLAEVHLDTSYGDDGNDGTSKDQAVATLDKAKELLAKNGTIYLHSAIYCNGRQTLSLEGYGDAKIERGPEQHGIMILLEQGADVTLEHITLDGGGHDRRESDNIIFAEDECRLTLNDGAVLQNNYSGAMGSAIAGWERMELEMNDGAVIRNNTTKKVAAYGSVFLANGGRFTMNGGTIENNQSNRGGGVAILCSDMVMNGGTISGNRTYPVLSSDGYGGGIYLADYENISGVSGAPNSIKAGKASFTMNGGSITGNTAQNYGGGILTFPQRGEDIVVEIRNGNITNNECNGSGGAMALFWGETKLDMTGGMIDGNTAGDYGGGIFLYGTDRKSIRISDGMISQNDAWKGGGLALYNSSTAAEISGGEICSNHSSGNGGGMYLGGKLHFSGGHVWDNTSEMTLGTTAAAYSNGIYVSNSTSQRGYLNISGSAKIDRKDDVAIGISSQTNTGSAGNCYINVEDVFTGASAAEPIEVTSVYYGDPSAVIEPQDIPGTKLVVFEEKAGGSGGAQAAAQSGLFVPSAAMLAENPLLYIGQSEGEDTWLIYREKDPEGALTVSKTVTGNDGEKNREFHFKVTLGDTGLSGTYGEMEFQNGVAEFTLKHGEQKSAAGLPEGISYQAEEKEAGQDGYKTSVSGESGVIVAGDTVTAAFENHREKGEAPSKPENPSKPSEPDHSEQEEADVPTPEPSAPVTKIPAQPVVPAVSPIEQQATEESPEAAENPQTGDGSAPVLWAVLAGISAAGLAAALMMGKRKKR